MSLIILYTCLMIIIFLWIIFYIEYFITLYLSFSYFYRWNPTMYKDHESLLTNLMVNRESRVWKIPKVSTQWKFKFFNSEFQSRKECWFCRYRLHQYLSISNINLHLKLCQNHLSHKICDSVVQYLKWGKIQTDIHSTLPFALRYSFDSKIIYLNAGFDQKYSKCLNYDVAVS